MKVETMKVVADNKDGYKIINVVDFDKGKHEKYPKTKTRRKKTTVK